jgi:phospholipid-translocating ATPase
VTYVAPLAFVLAVTMGKEAHDDALRHTRDAEANGAKYLILHGSAADGGPHTRAVPAAALRVGDLVLLPKDARVPADLVLLRTSDPGGTCFVRTDQLDGETDWKLRVAAPGAQALPDDAALLALEGEVYADAPGKDIHAFVGTLTIHNLPVLEDDIAVAAPPAVEPLTAENVLWANTVLASGSAVGFVIYTGPETRAVMNTSHPQTKTGLLDIEINRLAKVRRARRMRPRGLTGAQILCAVTFVLSFVLVALNGLRGTWYVYMMRFLILFSSIIPIRCALPRPTRRC